jgi:twitching motility protein PilT
VRQQLATTLASVISQRLIPKMDGGRTAAREIMINTPAISNMIREAKIAQVRSVLETSSKEGMHSMDQDLQRLYKEKMISKEEAQMYMENPEVLEKFKLI